MKVLVSDYYDTIKINGKKQSIKDIINFKININAINKFRENGNKVVIATARRTHSIINELAQNKINYDYIISFNGLVIHDANQKLLYANYLAQDIIDIIIRVDYETNIIKEMIRFDVNDETIFYRDLIKIRLYAEQLGDINLLKNYVDDKLLNYDLENKVVTIKEKWSKADAIKYLIYNNYINKQDEIYTIGDSANDFDMIANCFDNGYTISHSNLSYSYPYLNKVKSVAKLVKRII